MKKSRRDGWWVRRIESNVTVENPRRIYANIFLHSKSCHVHVVHAVEWWKCAWWRRSASDREIHHVRIFLWHYHIGIKNTDHILCVNTATVERARNNIDRRSSNEHKKSQFLLIDFSGSWARLRRSSRCVNNSNDFSLCRRFFGVSSFFSHVRASSKVARNRLKFSPQFSRVLLFTAKKVHFQKKCLLY